MRVIWLFSCGLMVWAAAAARGAQFSFELQTSGTSLVGSLSVAAVTSGSLTGDYDVSTNPTGTRTKPGLFGAFGETENVAVAVDVNPALSAPVRTVPTGSFLLEINEAAGTVVLQGLQIDLLAGSPLAAPLEAALAFESFRTRAPSSLFIGGFPVTLPLGEAAVTSLAAAQIGSAAGSLLEVGPGLYDINLSTLLLLNGGIEGGLGAFPLPPVPVPYTLSGRLRLEGGAAMLTASSTFEFADTMEVGGELPPLPFALPTVLPPGETGNVLFALTLESLDANLSTTLALTAPGRVIPEPGLPLILCGLSLAIRRRRGNRG